MPQAKPQKPPLPLWQDGWYSFARRMASPNFGPRPADLQPDLIVIHAISLPPGDYGTGQVQRLFTNQLDWDAHDYFRSIRGLKVSAHFFITRDGQLWQFVSCNDRAWHAGESTYRCKDNCNDFSVGIELEGLEGLLFEQAQYDTLSSLSAALLQAYPISQVAGHEHIAPGRKRDPGAGFNWSKLQRSLGLGPTSFPDEVAVIAPN
ncbi:MAG: 1,6-anhydro-N-acetylmuramyl-L-alanine amidase AmpD [Polaromonas sp.]|nr:1,6-anhydro-N-acetylmuramyl-L-alanine amidase AmpD [Polaromonas sp.]